VPQSKPFRSAEIPGAFDRDPSPETSSSPSGDISENLDERALLSFLKELIAAGNHGLDPILETLVGVARELTGASAAALAMWKEGAMVCRARSGDLAPVLGAQLNAKTGISGECLRAGKIQHCADTENDPLVDLEVCRTLGLRSIAVLPIRGWRGVNGILEVFSTQPAAFTKNHIALLQQLAAFAERARASQPESASSAAPKPPPKMEKPRSAMPLGSDRVKRTALPGWGTRSRPVVLGALLGLVAISLLALAIWLGWRGPERDEAAQATPSSIKPTSVSAANAGTDTAGSATLDVAIGHSPGSDAGGQASPAGGPLSLSALSPSRQKPSAGSPVKLASKVDAVAGTKTRAERAPANRSQLPGSVAPNVVIKYGSTNPQTDLKTESHPDSLSDLHSDATTSVEPPVNAAASPSQSVLNGVLSAKASLPALDVPVSRGVSGGQLVHRVPPVYPPQARVLRQEGTVVLAAVIMENGTLQDVKVIDGPPIFARSAVDAVKRWRYKPYELDGKPVKNEIRISVDFKLPEANR
jgi:TonB family protein